MLKPTLLLTIGLVLGACATPKPIALPPSVKSAVITGKEQRALVALKPGGTVTLMLQANAAAGYRWRLARPLDGKVLAMVSSPAPLPAIALPPDNPAPARPTAATPWTFKSVGPGTTKVRLVYTYLNEPLDEVAPFEFTVIAE